jgi:hypothetical protein
MSQRAQLLRRRASLGDRGTQVVDDGLLRLALEPGGAAPSGREPLVKRGRPPLPQCVKSIHQLRRFATRKELLLEDAAELRTLETAQLEELEQTVAALQGHLADVMKKLREATEHSEKPQA